MKVDDEELNEMRALQVAWMIQMDQLDGRVRRLRWWTLTLAILLVCVTVLLCRLVLP